MNENLGKSNMNEEQLTKLNTTKRVQNKRWEKIISRKEKFLNKRKILNDFQRLLQNFTKKF